MRKVQARELIDDPDYSGRLSMDGFHRLLLQAGYGAEVARKAASQRGWDRLAAGEML